MLSTFVSCFFFLLLVRLLLQTLCNAEQWAMKMAKSRVPRRKGGNEKVHQERYCFLTVGKGPKTAFLDD